MADTRLKIRAEDRDDIPALSGLMQDALIQRRDIAYEKGARRLSMLANRFRWEALAERRGWLRRRAKPTRIRTLLRFDFVDSVKSRALEDAAAAPLNLLAITAIEPADVPTFALTFSGGAQMLLTCEVIDVTLDDVSAPWQASAAPKHGT